jgi:hypothetical protein
MSGIPIIGISTYLATDYGPWIFPQRPGSSMEKSFARVNRFKTLDGGVAFSHRGFSHSDREMRVKAELTESQVIDFRDAVENTSYFLLFNREGVFKTLVKKHSYDGTDLTISFYVASKEDA